MLGLMHARSYFARRMLAAAPAKDERNQLLRLCKEFREIFDPLEKLPEILSLFPIEPLKGSHKSWERWIVHTFSSNEHRYNDAHVLTRNPIERCFGVWKRRFPVMSLKIRLALDTVQAVIIATSILHNICRMQGVAEVEPEVDLPLET